MKRLFVLTMRLACAVCALLVSAQSASAQPRAAGFFRIFGEIPAIALAQLEEVQQALNLDEPQKTKVVELNDELRADAADVFQNSNGDFDVIHEQTAKLFAEFGTKLNAVLKEPQQKRAEEIYVQVNGGTALMNTAIADKLKITSQQKEQLDQAADDEWEKTVDSFDELRNMDDSERDAAIEKLIDSRNQSLLAVLDADQRKEFDKLQGEVLEIDLANLPGPGR